MPETALLDTNVAIYLATGHALAERYRRHIEGHALALSFVTVAELLYTSRRAREPEQTLLYPDLHTCEIWAAITAASRRRGRSRQDNDLWIAATALRHRVPLVTHNRKDFVDIPNLTVISEAPSPA